MYNNYSFTRRDDGTINRVEFQSDTIEQVVLHFVDFLRGCGFFDETIYAYMGQQAEDYFDAVKKKEQFKSSGLHELD